MPRFLFIVSYSPEGVRGVLAGGGSARKTAVEKSVAGVGGRLESFDFAFGSDDVYLIAELPDHESAAALALTATATGALRSRTVVLLTPEQIDRAAQLNPAYTPPGQTG